MEFLTAFEAMSAGGQMFYAGLAIGAAGLLAAVILSVCRGIGKRRLDRILSRDYSDGDRR